MGTEAGCTISDMVGGDKGPQSWDNLSGKKKKAVASSKRFTDAAF